MKYDSNGMRIQKEDNKYVTNYYYDSENNLIGLDKSGTTLFFYYDSNGTPTSFSNNGVMYYYVKNLQGDIVKITKQDGTVVASYIYDVSGKLLSVKSNEIMVQIKIDRAAYDAFALTGYDSIITYIEYQQEDAVGGRYADDNETYAEFDYKFDSKKKQLILTDKETGNVYHLDKVD